MERDRGSSGLSLEEYKQDRRHEYDKVSDVSIWNVPQQRLPTLRDAAERALDASVAERRSS